MSALLPLLHLCDSLFPIGGFSHSDGLETATSQGQIRTGRDLAAWMSATACQSLRHLDGPAVARAWTAIHDRSAAALAALDEEVYALRPSAAGREATRAMGSRLLNTWVRIRPETADALRLRPASAGRPSDSAPMPPLPTLTLPVAFGAVCAASGIAQQDAVYGYAYTRLSATVSAALRLMPLGQHEGHRVLSVALAAIDGLAPAVCADPQTIAAFTPLQDLSSMRHQYLHSRLFRS